MVYLSRIYTKTGDAGDTGLGGGRRVPKNHPGGVRMMNRPSSEPWLASRSVVSRNEPRKTEQGSSGGVRSSHSSGSGLSCSSPSILGFAHFSHYAPGPLESLSRSSKYLSNSMPLLMLNMFRASKPWPS